ncbi:MAG: N-6 DNA methylase [Pseudomonadota bacterium]
MALDDPREARAVFLRSFKQLAPYRHRYEVWRDFVTMAACALHNGLNKDQMREDEYLEIIGRYKPDDQKVFPELMALLVTMLEAAPRDVLGPLYMELEIANKNAGQFFTLPELSEMMARLTFSDQLAKLASQPFITMQEPACGAGGMVLALVKVLIDAGYHPADKLWVQCIDVDRLAALMCYIQLTLWHVPAEVVVGNTLSLETREVWHTPAHHLGFWANKLQRRNEEQDALALDPQLDGATDELGAPSARPEPIYEEHQLDWHGQELTVRWCEAWMGDETGHLEIVSADKTAHPISETGYRSHFIRPEHIEVEGGPVAYVEAWLRAMDDGKPKQLTLF